MTIDDMAAQRAVEREVSAKTYGPAHNPLVDALASVRAASRHLALARDAGAAVGSLRPAAEGLDDVQRHISDALASVRNGR